LCVTTTGKKTPEALLCGERIRAARESAGIDRNELARRTKIGYSALGNYEQGLRELSIRAAKRIAKATGVPAAYLMGLIEEPDMELLQAPEGVRASFLQTLRSVLAATLPAVTPSPFPTGRPPLNPRPTRGS
jgi:transcriptional regulator with XRE-family HTH domain